MVNIFKTLKELNRANEVIRELSKDVALLKEQDTKKDKLISMLGEEVKDLREALEQVENTQNFQNDFSSAWKEAINGLPKESR